LNLKKQIPDLGPALGVLWPQNPPGPLGLPQTLANFPCSPLVFIVFCAKQWWRHSLDFLKFGGNLFASVFCLPKSRKFKSHQPGHFTGSHHLRKMGDKATELISSLSGLVHHSRLYSSWPAPAENLKGERCQPASGAQNTIALSRNLLEQRHVRPF
jgi:hypothetical protein